MGSAAMLKFGVTRRGEFARRALARERAREGWWPFAYTLLAAIEQDYSEADEPLLERLYQSMGAGEGIFKITRRNRFPEVDSRLIEDCRQRFPVGERPLVIHDVGCSSGISSLELFESFRRSRPVEIHASDYYDRLYLVDIPSTDWTVVFDAAFDPLQVVSRWLVLSPRGRTSWRYPINRLAEYVVCRRIIPEARERLIKSLDRDCQDDGVRQVSLFHPRAARAARQSDGFVLRRHNLFDPNPVVCDVLRAMNVLTMHHFPEDRVRAGIRSCLANIRPGGLLLLGRSVDEEDGRTVASAYRVGLDGLEEAWRINEGYEHPEFVSRDTCR